MSVRENAMRWVDQQARVTAVTGQGNHYATGRVIAYQEAPTVLIELDNGQQISWAAHLVDDDQQDGAGK